MVVVVSPHTCVCVCVIIIDGRWVVMVVNDPDAVIASFLVVFFIIRVYVI